MAVARQVYDRFKAAGKSLKDGDIGIVDAAETHYYQVGGSNTNSFGVLNFTLPARMVRQKYLNWSLLFYQASKDTRGLRASP